MSYFAQDYKVAADADPTLVEHVVTDMFAAPQLQSMAPISRPFHPNRCSNQERDLMKDIPGIEENGNPQDGPFKLYFKNGLISCQGEFENGKKSGKWKYLLNNGQMQSSGRFKDGKIVGRWKWFFKTGEPRATGGFDDEEQKHGLWKRYNSNGQLWDEGRFEHGKERGTRKVYDEAGELLKTQTFYQPNSRLDAQHWSHNNAMHRSRKAGRFDNGQSFVSAR